MHACGAEVAANIDPIEKNFLCHFLRGTSTFSITSQGCNFHCGFYQNRQISRVFIQKDSNLKSISLLPGDIVAGTF